MKHVRYSGLNLALFVVVHTSFLLAPAGAQVSAESVFPAETWEYVEKDDLRAYGWSPEALERTTDFIRDEANTTGLVVVDRGRVVYGPGAAPRLSEARRLYAL